MMSDQELLKIVIEFADGNEEKIPKGIGKALSVAGINSKENPEGWKCFFRRLKRLAKSKMKQPHEKVALQYTKQLELLK